MDIVGALTAILMFSPILISVYLVLLITTRGKPLIFQERVGYLGRRFWMIKFRTMRLDADKMQHLVKNEHYRARFSRTATIRGSRGSAGFCGGPALTRCRSCSMCCSAKCRWSGPRPPLAKEVAKYKAWHRRRLAIMPGLTIRTGAVPGVRRRGGGHTTDTQHARSTGRRRAA